MDSKNRGTAPTLRSPERLAVRTSTAMSTVHFIINTVARQCGLRAADITGPSVRADIVEARDQVCYLARDKGMTLPQIGRAVNRHHTSVLSAVRREAIRRGETA